MKRPLVVLAAVAGVVFALAVVTPDAPHAWCATGPQAAAALQVEVAAHVAAIHRNSPEQSVSESTIQAALMAECAR